ncbi:MAG: N-formylglutamate amidohydrolase [Pirellulaceae bacterium]|nr:N-formylglutamate amidohydrolase [Planctomycetales bacterium]
MRHLVLSCEHASNRVPGAYRYLFRAAAKELSSHVGWDPGAKKMAQMFHRQLNAPLYCHPSTRLLVEPNRSLGHRRLFSRYTACLDPQTKKSILRRFYHPYRDQVETAIKERVQRNWFVVHVSVHSFTPSLNGQHRNADVGLLYDPTRPREKILCRVWESAIKQQRNDLRIRRNYPYRGAADGFTTYLRKRFSQYRYAGIELEVNQAWLHSISAWNQLAKHLAQALSDALEDERLAS